MVKDEEELSRKIRFFLANPLEADRLGRAGKELLSLNQGATERNLELTIKKGSDPFFLNKNPKKKGSDPFFTRDEKNPIRNSARQKKGYFRFLLVPFLYLFVFVIRNNCPAGLF